MIDKPGIYRIPMAEYLALPYLSSGLCNTILTHSVRHARHDQQFPDTDGATASDTGTAIHDALLEGVDRIASIDAADWRTKAAKEARDAARAEGKIPMLSGDVSAIKSAVSAARDHVEASELAGIFDDGEPELTLIWEENGVLCKARPDWLTADRQIMLHVKTTPASANPDTWIKRQLIGAGYDVAAAFYTRALHAACPSIKKTEAVFLVIEQDAPHGCSLIGLSPMSNEIADRKVESAISAWVTAVKTDKWPCYTPRICYAEPPIWAQKEHEELRSHEPEPFDPELAMQA